MAKSMIALNHYAHAVRFWQLMGVWLLLIAGAAAAFFSLEHFGHAITGMSNHIVWGFPHVIAIFLIVAASGVLNVASIASVFGRTDYKPYAPLSAWMSIALLIGGLAVLVLDLGKPDRLTVAMTHFNWTSMFAWNVFLYTGLLALAVVYLWTMYDKRVSGWSSAAGIAVFLWRLVLTSGTGLIFGFLVGREGYGTALLAPAFLALSFAWGWALFLLAQEGVSRWAGEPSAMLDEALFNRARQLFAVFLAAALYFVVIYHLTNLYFERNAAFSRFLLFAGGEFTFFFWIGYLLLGAFLPLWLVLGMGDRASVRWAALLTVFGGIAFLYAFIIGGQAWPLQPFVGYEVLSSGFDDGQVAIYQPHWPEVLLALGGIGVSGLLITLAVRVWPFVPVRT
jgi:molybdopterin-containing oxidoreductase family membrane subunit